MNDEIMRKLGFGKRIDAIENGFCPICNKPIVQGEFKNTLSKKEFKISGMCQKCQDSMFE